MRPNTSTNLSASAAASSNGIVIPADFVVALSAIAVVTGTSAGTLNIEASNDIAPSVDSNGHPSPTNWVNIPTTGTVSISGAGVYLIPKLESCYKWLRTSFVSTNGASGTIAVNVQTYGF